MLSLVAILWLGSAAPAVPDRVVDLNAHKLRLHFANPSPLDDLPLIVYATGDGGWHRKDLATYKEIAALGYPVVGFDAHDYVTHLGPSEWTTPSALAADYAEIIAAAKEALHLRSDCRVLLAGVSRGAGLAVVAAGDPVLRSSLVGVVAVALTREEEYVKRVRRFRRRDGNGPEMVEMYNYLPRLGPLPVTVVQSTRDSYVPAAEARDLFGPDTPYRWLQPVESRNHSFGGGRPQLYAAIARGVGWIMGLRKKGTVPFS